MSYANWNEITQYLTDDIVIWNAEDYVALSNNLGKQPDISGNPWSALAPPGPSPGNTLAFTKATTQLEIVGGNSVNITPQLGYTTGTSTNSLPANQLLSVGQDSVAITSVAQLKWIDPSLTAPASPNIPIYIETDPPAPSSPPAVYRWLESHWFKQDPNPALQQDKYFWMETGDGYTTLGSQWVGFAQQTINFDVNNLVIQTGSSGGGTGIIFNNGSNTGNLYQNSSGNLFWNATQLNGGGGGGVSSVDSGIGSGLDFSPTTGSVLGSLDLVAGSNITITKSTVDKSIEIAGKGGALASGIIKFDSGVIDVAVSTGIPLSGTPIVSLSYYNDGSTPPTSPYNGNPIAGENLWYDVVPNPAPLPSDGFYIRISTTPPVGEYFSVAWALLVA